MRKLFTALLLTIATLATNAGTITDVTSTYLTNPSFESDDISSLSAVNNTADGLRGYTVTAPTGWTVGGTSVTSLIVTKDCYTDNNFGKVTTVSDGSQAYYLRMGWSTGTTTLTQTTKKLPKGKYKLTADIRTGYANSATSSYSLTASGESTAGSFTQGSAGFMASLAWTTVETTFELSAAKTVSVGLTVDWLSGGSCIMVDNVRLYSLPDDYVEEEDPTESDVSSPTEGVITADFVSEETMMDDLLQMLANFSKYMKADFKEAQYTNSVNEACGCFMGENTMANDEKGVRPNADLSMICAFLVKYGKDKVSLPSGVTWTDLETMAMKSLIFAYSTHKANKLKVCSGGNYWGSTSTSDYTWESSLWAMSVAYSAYFQWDKLSDTQKTYIYNLLKAECNYELNRSIPTGFSGDTKAEENGWEADILAATLGLFPDDALASKWFDRLRLFAINSYSHADDKSLTEVLDSWYDSKTAADLYKGQNLYSDYTLQNHNYFHTSYQNVVMQELGEAALALKLFQGDNEKWKTNALKHNNDKVMKQVLNWLAMPDGELAMPNGNDWSLFLYDQITSYSTQACFEQDPDALLLENMAYKYIKARQTTTSDGSWLLNADVGARRMGVEAHRVMMTWLMHHVASTAELTPTSWDDFNSRYSEAKRFTTQNIVRASSDDRFTCFSWSTGLSSYTGYFAQNCPDKNKIIVPYRANNTGNLLGWYTVSGKSTNATPVVSGNYTLSGNSYTMNGELNTNDAALNNRFAIYATPGNAIIYLDYVRAKSACTITGERGALLAISTDPLTKLKRTLYNSSTHKQLDGSALTTMSGQWINIDNEIGILAPGDKQFAFGDRSLNNSIYTAKLYNSYSTESRTVSSGDVVDNRTIVYYSNVTSEETSELADALVQPTVDAGKGCAIATDPDGTAYMLISNFLGTSTINLADVMLSDGAPIFEEETTVGTSGSAATFTVSVNRSKGETLKFFIKGSGVTAKQAADDSTRIDITATAATTITISAAGCESVEATMNTGDKLIAQIIDGAIVLTQKTTGIGTATATPFADERAYDLSGRPATATTQGITIAHGQKTLRRQ